MDIINFYARDSQMEVLASIHCRMGQTNNWLINSQLCQAISKECSARTVTANHWKGEQMDNNNNHNPSMRISNWSTNGKAMRNGGKSGEEVEKEREAEERVEIDGREEILGEKSYEAKKRELLALIREMVGEKADECRGDEIGRVKLDRWRASFRRALAKRTQAKFRLRNVLCERMYEFNVQRLRATAVVDPRQLSLADLRIRERYALRGDRLMERATGRLFVSQEEIFDALLQFHAGTGHGGQKKALYRRACRIFANISKELVREFLQGCSRCGGWREKKCQSRERPAADGSTGGEEEEEEAKYGVLMRGISEEEEDD